MIRLYSKLRKGNTGITLLITQYQWYSKIHNRQNHKLCEYNQITDTMEINIHITKTMFELPPSVKTFNVESLDRSSSADTKIFFVSNPSGFILTVLESSIKLNDTISSNHMNKNTNNIYQGLIWTKTILRPVIGTLMPINKVQGTAEAYSATNL